MRRKNIYVAAFGAALTWTIYLIGIQAIESIFFPAFIASAFAAFYAECFARIQKAPATVFLVVSVIPLIPGGSLYYTMNNIVQNFWKEALGYGKETCQYALGIALGMSLIWMFSGMFKRIRF